MTAIIGQFEYLNQKRGLRQQVIAERKAGEILDVLDVASLPIDPVSPNRWLLAAAGFGLGMLIGAITIRFRRPGTPAIALAESLRVSDSGAQDPGGYVRSALKRIVTA